MKEREMKDFASTKIVRGRGCLSLGKRYSSVRGVIWSFATNSWLPRENTIKVATFH